MYDVTQPSVREVIGVTGSVRRATVIEDYAFTITTRQDRTPAQVIDCGKGRYRYLTELECWRLQGYTDEDFERAKKAQQNARKNYWQQNSGNTQGNGGTYGSASSDNRTQQSQTQHAKRGVPKHRCAVCGRTELDDENLTFRFCSKCAGNYEYCSDHLYTHIHVTGDK